MTEPASTTTFRNEIVAWGPRGHVVAEFEKVHRVPFGEYVPFRSFFSHFADLSGVPLDAVPGHGTGLMRTPAGPLGVLVSFEMFYAGRSHSSVRAGAQLLVVPDQHVVVPHVTGSGAGDRGRRCPGGGDGPRPRAGRADGYSAVVTQRGVVVARSALGKRQVLWPPWRCAAA